MQVENHKEEVPFAYYQGLFEAADANQMAEKTGVTWDGKDFYVNLLGVEYRISHPKYGIRVVGVGAHTDPTGRSGDRPLQEQTFLLRYLLEGKQVSWKGGWKTFREMPWGELYF